MAKRLPNIKYRASKECRWAHTTKTTHKDLAKVMIALRDTIEKWCFKTDGKADKLKTFKFLCNSCCNTHLLSLAFVRMMNLESKIDRSVRRNIGTANEGVAFKTEGTIDLELEIRDVEGVWNTLCLTWHVLILDPSACSTLPLFARVGGSLFNKTIRMAATGHA